MKKTAKFRAVLMLLALAGAVLVGGWQENSKLAAQDKANADLPADLDAVPRSALGFVSIRVADLWNHAAATAQKQKFSKESSDLVQVFKENIGTGPVAIERLTMVVGGRPDSGLFFVATVKPFDPSKILKVVAPDAKEEKEGEKVIYVSKDKEVHFIDKQTYVVGRPQEVKNLLSQGEKKEGPLNYALKLAAKKHHVAAGANVAAIAQLIGNNLPAELEQFKPILEAKTATATADLGEDAGASAQLVFDGEDQAKAAEKALKLAVELGQQTLAQGIQELEKDDKGIKNVISLLKKLEANLKDLPIQVKGSTVESSLRLKVELPVVGLAFAEGVMKIRTSANRIRSANNLRQIVLAMHNYADSNGAFPAHAVYSKNGKPLLSWRVLLLPYLEQQELYNEFKLDEPWDSDPNKKLLAKMPRIYGPLDGQAKAPYATFYQAFVGKMAGFEGTEGMKLSVDFPDGISNTILFVEAAKPVPWTKPEDLTFDPDKSADELPKLGGLFKEGFNAGLCDGSVRFFPHSIKKETLRAYITRNGGEVIQDQ